MALVKPRWPVLRSDLPLARGLVAAWPFFEGAGGTVNDVVENIIGTRVGAPSSVGSPFGAALNLNGTSQYVSLASDARLDTPSSPISVAVSCLLTGVTSGIFCGFYATSGGFNGWGLGTNVTTGVGSIEYWSSTHGTWVSSANSLLNNALWNNVLITVDSSGTVSFYLNGVLKGTAASSLPASYTGTRVIGAASDGASSWFPGVIGHVAIWNRKLSAQEVAEQNFDPFAIYRPRSRWWEVPAASGAFTNRPGPSASPTVPFGLAIAGAKLLERNPIMRRRELFRWVKGESNGKHKDSSVWERRQ